VALRKSAVAAL